MGRFLPGRVPGALRGGVTGAATGGLLGAAGGAISGAILGGVGLAAAAGSAVAGFEDRALHDAVLAPGFSATGYVYYPRGSYRRLEMLLTDDAGQVERVEIPIDAP